MSVAGLAGWGDSPSTAGGGGSLGPRPSLPSFGGSSSIGTNRWRRRGRCDDDGRVRLGTLGHAHGKDGHGGPRRDARRRWWCGGLACTGGSRYLACSGGCRCFGFARCCVCLTSTRRCRRDSHTTGRGGQLGLVNDLPAADVADPVGSAEVDFLLGFGGAGCLRLVCGDRVSRAHGGRRRSRATDHLPNRRIAHGVEPDAERDRSQHGQRRRNPGHRLLLRNGSLLTFLPA